MFIFRHEHSETAERAHNIKSFYLNDKLDNPHIKSIGLVREMSDVLCPELQHYIPSHVQCLHAWIDRYRSCGLGIGVSNSPAFRKHGFHTKQSEQSRP